MAPLNQLSDLFHTVQDCQPNFGRQHWSMLFTSHRHWQSVLECMSYEGLAGNARDVSQIREFGALVTARKPGK